MITNDFDADIPTWAELNGVWTGKGAIILPELPVPSSHVYAALVSLLDGDGDVNITSHGRGRIPARYIAVVWVGVEDGEVQQTRVDSTLPIDKSAIDPNHGGVDVIGAQWLDTSQRWRIL